MESIRSGDDLMVRLDPGEEIHASLQALCAAEGITSAAVTSGIGRVCDIDVGFLGSEGVYQRVVLSRSMELLSCQGNVAEFDDSPFTHIHIVLSDDLHRVHGGHLFSAHVAVTAELHLRVLDAAGPMTRCSIPESEFKPLRFSADGSAD